jgi:hypothetical protein
LLNSTPATDALALFCELGLSRDARVAQKPASSFDSALVFSSCVGEGTLRIAALS